MFVFDLDGTLLTSDEELTDENREAVLRVSKDHTVVLASGRMLRSVLRFSRENFGTEFPTIAYNGAMVYVPGEGVVFHDAVDPNTASKVVERLRKMKIHRQAYVDDELVVEEDNEHIKSYAEHSGVDYKLVEDLADFVLQNGSTKLLAIDTPEVLDSIIPDLRGEFQNLNIFKSFPTYLDFVKKGINKAKALVFLSKVLGFDLKDTVVFGDNDNDYEIIEIAGLGVAMGNATERVKGVADLVAPSNDDSGVASVVDGILSGRIRFLGRSSQNSGR